MSICITLCTRGRPQMLARCLSSLCPAIARMSEPVFVVVVENDTEVQSRDIVMSFTDRLDIHYAQEVEPGIPFARNRAIETALSIGFDWLIFIDDDEWVAEDWLTTFTAARNTYPDAEVLTGPVLRDYPANAPGWLPHSGRAGHATGTRLPAAATNNTMVAARLFRPDGLAMRLNEQMRYTGGSDTEFFLRFSRKGGQVIWVEEARVFEEYPDNRSTLSWHIQRNIRRASGGVMIERMHGQSKLRYVVPRVGQCLYLGLGRIVQGTGQMLFGRRRGRDQMTKGLLSLASAWGYLRGLFNLQSNPYQRIDGY
ncbi:glycosyltransferase family 2 protein [Rhodobacteraceae bacterium N5(2021)]|uniref:Glycosyltransferase family 2 protein n=1 Tax=Gymnodinialimonas phycosphaerae TaxID=2841589 RepID=A0A975YI61_9RHOB|nr:glycosyltransferase family 2 protein [Gymnodinialimonas phycosphaerae]MBY4895368.1 glycosyltransferase family 2 protein [Gymnodinialimonas phycosphaerae]